MKSITGFNHLPSE